MTVGEVLVEGEGAEVGEEVLQVAAGMNYLFFSI